LESSQNEYTSLIGSDKKSWGYSYKGKLNGYIRLFFNFVFFLAVMLMCFFFIGVKHHDGESLIYGQKYDQGDALIGVRLDMCRGTLEFFLNRTPLGECYDQITLLIK